MMKTNKIKPIKALNQAFRKVKPNRNHFDNFKCNLIKLLDSINEAESEEFHKNLMADFLKTTYYGEGHFINTKNTNDFVIHNGKDASSTVGVIMEAKKPNAKVEMAQVDKLNVKALQQLMLYFLRERIVEKNLEVKHLIVTNIYEWFIFDAKLFERFFVENKELVKQFHDFQEGRLSSKNNPFFYREIAAPAMEQIEDELSFTYFDIREYEEFLRNPKPESDRLLIPLFKIFSPEHLLKLPFANDSNTLDRAFYSELLHIIGLEETSKGGKNGGQKLIQRQKEGDRHEGSLIENAMLQLDSSDKISRLEKPELFGENDGERLFNVALELALTWINRVLFLKLLEAQLIAYHKKERSPLAPLEKGGTIQSPPSKGGFRGIFSFLNLDKIPTYNDLNGLFFDVLAKKPGERKSRVKDAFAKVPYLNSSLFEATELEQQTIFISNLGKENLPVFASTVLKDRNGNKLTGEINALEYLFEFLDAYDFSSEGSEDIQEENKTLINASVLGSIFEKINGYKDGSFFTPGFITMYMSRETIRRAVVEKFNEVKGWNCQTIDDLYDKIEDKREANAIINSLKICDPAVGSGHFLVSALNEIIAIKSKLKILLDRQGKTLRDYRLAVENDELIVTDDDGNFFEYSPKSEEKQRVQEALFHEKQTIIESCLFGVDVNPNSVKICRLRLWIELLKNAYYKKNNHKKDSNYEELETLPNIDINIKCGNSLISRFALDDKLQFASGKTKRSIEDYRKAVQNYRRVEDKKEKRQIVKSIEKIKGNFRTTLQGIDPRKTRLRQLEGEVYGLENQLSLFEESEKEKKARERKIAKLNKEIDKLSVEIEEIESAKVFDNAFEWRFEFPEALNDEGDFVGFDVVIGNPPYGILATRSELAILCEQYQRFGISNSLKDSYFLFCLLALKNVLKPWGHLCYIMPNTWKLIKAAQQFRHSLIGEFCLLGVDEFKNKIFNEATVDCDIIFAQKKKVVDYSVQVRAMESGVIDRVNLLSKTTLLKQKFFNLSLSNKELLLLDKIDSRSGSLEKYFEIKNGVKPYEKGKGHPPQTREIVKQKPYTAETKLNETFQPLIGGRYFNKYVNLWNGNYWISYGKWLAAPREESIFKADEKLIVRQTSDRIIATLIPVGFIIRDNTHIILKKNEEFSLKYLLGILNSKLVDFVYTSMNPEKGEALAQVKVFHLEMLPFSPLSIQQQVPFIKKVDEIIATKKSNPNADTTALEKEIDRLIYQLYQLTEEEIKIVEGDV